MVKVELSKMKFASNKSTTSWLTSLSCSSSVIEDNSVPPIVQWLRFIFLSPCPQRALLFSLDILFLLLLLVFAIRKICLRLTSNDPSSSGINKPLIQNDRALVRTNLWFNVSLCMSIFYACRSLALGILAFGRYTQLEWKVVDGLFWLLQALTHLVITVLIVCQKRFRAVTHLLLLRIYWIVNCIVTALFFTPGIIRLISFQGACPDLWWDDMVSLVSFPSSIVLLIVAVRGSTGILLIENSESPMDAETNLYERPSG